MKKLLILGLLAMICSCDNPRLRNDEAVVVSVVCCEHEYGKYLVTTNMNFTNTDGRFSFYTNQLYNVNDRLKICKMNAEQ